MPKHGIDYTETFAPTVRMCAIRVLLSLAAYYDWEAEQLDVVTAFLEEPVEEEIHMKLPEGFKKYDCNGHELVCKMHKALYGLKQAPRNRNLAIAQCLVEYGFIQSKVDRGIYVYHKGKLTNVLVLCVVGSILVGPSGPFVSEFKIAFGRRLTCKTWDMLLGCWTCQWNVIRMREHSRWVNDHMCWICWSGLG